MGVVVKVNMGVVVKVNMGVCYCKGKYGSVLLSVG
jgi:hypothetical protein